MKISIICPFYNEEDILKGSIKLMMENLATLSEQKELIIVNDGSIDRSLEIAQDLEQEYPHLRVLSYPRNMGRGYAIRTGMAHAQGDIVVTTEIDSSWGDDIVHRIVDEFKRRPDADMVIASPHLPGGGYKNVPVGRKFLSLFGNYFIRAALVYSITMNTGMTRGYLREKFLQLPLDEDGKEMHLEIINKATAFGYRVYEIPAILEWKTHKLTNRPERKRKSSSNVNKLIWTHLLFSLISAPFRFIYPISALLFVGAAFFFGWAIRNFFTPDPSIFLAITAFFLAIFGLFLSGIGILAQQGRELQRELWRIRSSSKRFNGEKK